MLCNVLHADMYLLMDNHLAANPKLMLSALILHITSTQSLMHGKFALSRGGWIGVGYIRRSSCLLACRHAGAGALRGAVENALLCTHVHPEGIEVAFIQAAAVAVLCQAEPQGTLPVTITLIQVRC